MRSLSFALLALVGCSAPSSTPDAATVDADSVDRATPVTDAGVDAGSDLGSDLGTTDAPAAIDLGGPIPCTAGRVESCPCAGGGPGAQTCGPTGAYGPCVCLTSDAAVPTDAVAPTDAITPTDAGGVTGDDYCRALAAGVTCTGAAVNNCGVCVRPSTSLLARTQCDRLQRRESCHAGAVGAPDLGCFAPGGRPTAGASEPVTLWGHVTVRGNGGDSQHIRISVHRVNADGTPGALVGAAVSNTAGPAAVMEDVYSPSRDRVLFTRRTGGYQIANVPTETELLVVTEGDPADTEASGLWSHRVYTYDVVVLNTDVNATAAPAGVTGTRTARYLPLAFSNSDWTALPATSTLTSGITAGRGMILGEVHDCADARLENATVESTPLRRWDGPVVYFSENDTNPLPDLSREMRGTSLLGIFMLLDVDPGPVRVAALGRASSSSLLHLGSRRVRAFPDAVTYVSIRGLRPW